MCRSFLTPIGSPSRTPGRDAPYGPRTRSYRACWTAPSQMGECTVVSTNAGRDSHANTFCRWRSGRYNEQELPCLQNHGWILLFRRLMA